MLTTIIIVSICLVTAVVSIVVTKNPKNEIAEKVEPIAEQIIENQTGIEGKIIETAIEAVAAEIDKAP